MRAFPLVSCKGFREKVASVLIVVGKRGGAVERRSLIVVRVGVCHAWRDASSPSKNCSTAPTRSAHRINARRLALVKRARKDRTDHELRRLRARSHRRRSERAYYSQSRHG